MQQTNENRSRAISGQALLRDWLWPCLVGLCVLLGLAMRNSDHARWAFTLYGMTALLASVAWFWPIYESPSLHLRPHLRPFFLSLIGFLLALSILPLVTLVNGKSGSAGGLYDPSMAALEYIKLAGLMTAFSLGFRVGMNDEQARRLMDILLYAGGIWALLSIIMFILDPNGIYGYQKMAGGRLTGALSSANSAGTLFGSISVMAFARILSRFWQSKARSLLEKIEMPQLAIFLACLAALLLTLSRMGAFATLICLMVVAVILSWKRLPIWVLLLGALASSLLIAGIFSVPMQALMDRLDNADADAQVRATIFKAHFDIASKQAWLGSGLGAFNPINNTILNEANYRDLSVIGAAHNVYLQWFEETGMVGLLALVCVNFAVLVPIIQAGLARKSIRGRLWAIVAAYGVFLIHGLSDYGFQEPALAVFIAVVMGMGLAMATNSNRLKRI